MEHLGVLKDTEERMYLLCMDVANTVKGFFEVSHGTVNSTGLNERGMAQRALLSDATGIITIHNHPSGKTDPSSQDLKCFKQIRDLCRILGLEYYDNIIVGKNYFSFREFGLMKERCKDNDE